MKEPEQGLVERMPHRWLANLSPAQREWERNRYRDAVMEFIWRVRERSIAAGGGRTPGGRFIQKIDFTPGCWLWRSSKQGLGYGAFKSRGRSYQAHRYAYEVMAPIPEDMDLDHLCCVKACVNPFHMEPVTAAENRRRALAVRMGKKAASP